MNATLGNYPAAEMKASDADRDAVLSELSEHFQAGRLTNAEFDERAGQALAARTWGELRDLLRDLPTAWPGPAATPPAAPPERPSGRPAALPVAALAGIAIAVAVSVGVAHDIWGFWWVLLVVLFVTRRVVGRLGLGPTSQKEVPIMDGSSASLIAIPIVTSPLLAVWLIVVYYAASHPQWKHGAQAPGQENPTPADGQLRTAEPRPAAQARADADHDATPEKHAKLAA